jgi:hypothetical protein
MSGFTEGRREESVWLPPLTLEITDCLQWAYEALESGHEARLVPDPFSERAGGRPRLTDADVDRIILAVDAEYDHEIRVSPSHHLNRSGATERTELHRLGPRARRALAERLDAILTKHETIDQSAPPPPNAPPAGAVPDFEGG